MRAAASVALVVAVGCAPQIDKGTYYCGPERFCPPDLVCDEPTFTCEVASLADAFVCPDGSEAFEPDDGEDDAHDLGATQCGQPLVDVLVGCLEGDDVDHLRLTYDDGCSGADPHLEIDVSFPVAFAPVRAVLHDASGAEVAAGEPCTPVNDLSGSDVLCIEASPPTGVYFLRLELQGELDCDGECRFNQYRVDVAAPSS